MSDTAFLVMDLVGRSRPDLAAVFLDAYVGDTGDYAGVALLPFYAVYRALVRAMVDTLAAEAGAAGRQAFTDRARARIRTAAGFASPPPAVLVAMHGPSGSGKSWLSERLVARVAAVRIRSDVERKRLAGAAPEARPTARRSAGARACLEGGVPTILDAASLRRVDRDRYRALAAAAGVPLVILSCRADPAVLAARVAARQRRGADPSDADRGVLETQLATLEPVGADERTDVVEIATAEPGALERAIAAIAGIRSR
jgi:predicted kinase